MNVLFFWTEKWKSLPNRLKNLLLDDSIMIAGNKVSGDLEKIGRDFKVQDIISVEQKYRPNVVNLAMLAKTRGLVTDARAVSLEYLSKVLLDVKVDIALQTSGFSGQLTKDQINYAAIDRAVSLECYEKSVAMPDILCHLKISDLSLCKKVGVAN